MSENIELDLDHDTQCSILEVYLRDTLSKPSFEVFGEIAEEVGLDLEALQIAAGKAVMNEAMIRVIEFGISLDKIDTQNKLTGDTKMSNKDPQFCIITPTPYLRQFASQSSMHLVLAHLVDTDEQYANFYADRTEFKIMDNGAFELGQSYAPDKLIELGRKCGADAIVLPDYPFQPAKVTVDASQALIDQVKDAGFKTMYVPQSETGELEDWIKGYRWGASNPSIDIIGMSILGVPNALPHIHIGFARVVMTQILIERGIFNFDKYHHYLGLNAGPSLELPSLIEMGALDSCDSSGPVWAGICGHRYAANTDSLQTVQKIQKHVDFDYPLSTKQSTLDDIQYNIDLTLGLFEK